MAFRSGIMPQAASSSVAPGLSVQLVDERGGALSQARCGALGMVFLVRRHGTLALDADSDAGELVAYLSDCDGDLKIAPMGSVPVRVDDELLVLPRVVDPGREISVESLRVRWSFAAQKAQRDSPRGDGRLLSFAAVAAAAVACLSWYMLCLGEPPLPTPDPAAPLRAAGIAVPEEAPGAPREVAVALDPLPPAVPEAKPAAQKPPSGPPRPAPTPAAAPSASPTAPSAAPPSRPPRRPPPQNPSSGLAESQRRFIEDFNRASNTEWGEVMPKEKDRNR